MATPGDRELEQILTRLEQAHDRLIRMIAATVADTPAEIDAETYLVTRLAAIDRLILEARKELEASQRETTAKIAAFIAAGVAVGAVIAAAELRAAARAGATLTTPGVPGIPGSPGVPASPATRNANTMLAKQAAEDLAKVHTGLLRQVPVQYQEIVAEAAREMRENGLPLKEAVGKVSERLGSKGVPGLVDRGGRRWKPESYAEMALRTTFARAATEGKIAQYAEQGERFVTISTSPAPCKACARWQGTILVIDGPVVAPAEATLADAEAGGLFHPRCTHSVSVYLPGFSEQPQKTVYDAAAYEASQTQRRLERETREARRRVIAAKAAGTDTSRAEALVARRAARLTTFLKETGRKRRNGADQI